MSALAFCGERRSPSRPDFVEGWSKIVRAKSRCDSTDDRQLPDCKVDVWICPIDSLLKQESCLALLSASDWKAVDDLRSEVNRNGSIAARVVLRLGLSRQVARKVEPSQWSFVRTERGLTLARGLPQLYFSIAHSSEVVVVAISAHHRVGVDVESVDQPIGHSMLSDYLHPDELHHLNPWPVDKQARAFVDLWTKKEAYTKMLGVGHGLPFGTVSLVPPDDRSKPETRSGTPVCFETFYEWHATSLTCVSLAVNWAGPGLARLQQHNLHAPAQPTSRSLHQVFGLGSPCPLS